VSRPSALRPACLGSAAPAPPLLHAPRQFPATRVFPPTVATAGHCNHPGLYSRLGNLVLPVLRILSPWPLLLAQPANAPSRGVIGLPPFKRAQPCKQVPHLPPAEGAKRGLRQQSIRAIEALQVGREFQAAIALDRTPDRCCSATPCGGPIAIEAFGQAEIDPGPGGPGGWSSPLFNIDRSGAQGRARREFVQQLQPRTGKSRRLDRARRLGRRWREIIDHLGWAGGHPPLIIRQSP